jgi:hypothetical protein
MERLLSESEGEKGKTTLEGPNLKPESLARIIREGDERTTFTAFFGGEGGGEGG